MANLAANADPLLNLRDIHLPMPINSWLVAPGWLVLYGLAGLTLMVFLWLAKQYYKQYDATWRMRHFALKQLEAIHNDYEHTQNLFKTCASIAELLKQVALACFPRETIASLQGMAWVSFLNQTANHVNFNDVAPFLCDYPYQPFTDKYKQSRNSNSEYSLNPLGISKHKTELDLFFSYTKTWIQQQRNITQYIE